MSPRPAADNDAAREAILARIRAALRVPGPLPHLKGPPPEPSLEPADTAAAGAGPSLPILAAERARPWLPDGGDSPEESLAILVDNLEKLRAVVWRAADAAEAAERLTAEATARGWRKVAWHDDPLVAPAVAGLACETYQVDAESEAGAGLEEGAAQAAAAAVATCDKEILEACDAGISGCECLVAQTGSILVSSAAGGRGISILPHVHVVIARLEQIVPTLADALAGVPRAAGGGQPSMLSLITGPSRTGDIERILVLGAHGPKELLVILVGER